MEIKCHITDPAFRSCLENLLDKLTHLYSIDTTKFMEAWKIMPSPLRMGITGTAANSASFVNTKYEELAEYCQEITMWFRAEYHRMYPVEKPFTLRNPDDLKQFEEFLDRMVHLMTLSPKHFMFFMETCPPAYWDKIDDLRETSFKVKRDSTEYLRCLEKCKKVSFFYSELLDLMMYDEDEEFYEEGRDNDF